MFGRPRSALFLSLRWTDRAAPGGTAGGTSGGGDRGADRPGSAERQALREALEKDSTSAEDLKAKLDAVRETRKKATTELAAAGAFFATGLAAVFAAGGVAFGWATTGTSIPIKTKILFILFLNFF